MKVQIEIDTRTFVRFWLVVIGFALALLAIYSALSALIIIGAAFFLAMALNGPVSRVARILPGRSRVGATAIAYIIVVLLIGVFVFLVVPPIVEQTAKFIETVPGLVNDATSKWQGLSHFIADHNLQPQLDGALNSLKNNASGWAANAGSTLINGLGSVLSVIAATFLTLVLSFLMLIEGPVWLKRIWGVYTDQDRMEAHRSLAKRMYNVVTGYVTGQLTVSGIDATLAGIVVFILSLVFHLPLNLALPSAAIAFVLSLIPMFGATIGGIIISLLLLFNNVTAGIIFAVYFIIYQQIENNFISPVIQSKRVELSALAVLVAITIGLYVFGIAGGLISIPIAGCIKVLVEDYLERAKHKRKKSERPLEKLVKKLQGKDKETIVQEEI
ncbi:MAG: AI-2E family transporter [Candidatus Saccharimonadales bacterium]